MTLLRDGEREVGRAVAALIDCNPFVPERLELERRALGDVFVPVSTVWHADGDGSVAAAVLNPNAAALRQLVERLGTTLRQRLAAAPGATAAELADYHGVVLYLLFQRYEDRWYHLIERAAAHPDKPVRVDWYEDFARAVHHFFAGVPGPPVDAALLFALGFQARRAFHHIFRQIFGSSGPVARLRAAVWQSLFTRNVRRYRTALYNRMGEIPTLITGESGTGKELAARAIALSRYLPFDTKTCTFAAPGFFAVNLSALSPSLVEAELFGHRRGAFTGATHAHRGWLEACGPYGAVFLDEIGELDMAIQVKLLRVLQTRQFHRLGETDAQAFDGKVIAATNRDLEVAMIAGRFRDDLYYRLCSDSIATPTLREQLADQPDDLHHLIRIIAGRAVGEPETDGLVLEVEDWVHTHLAGYSWPGNIRELEQCVRSIMIQGEYRPPRRPAAGAPAAALPAAALPAAAVPPAAVPAVVEEERLTAEEMVQRECAGVYAQTGSYQETARRLGLHRRTVRTKVMAWIRRPPRG